MSWAGGEPFITSLPFMEMPDIPAFQKEQEKKSAISLFFYRYEENIYLFSEVVTFFLLLKMLKRWFGRWLFNLGSCGMLPIHQWLPL